MDLLSAINMDASLWPYWAMAFLRVLTLFFFLPIFGDSAIPKRIRLTFALAFTCALWPMIVTMMVSEEKHLMQWSPVAIVLCSLRELVFGFVTGFTAKLLIYACSIASHAVGTSIGFQTANLFNPSLDSQESSYSVFKNWIVVIVLLNLNFHHIMLTGIVHSFERVPLGALANLPNFFQFSLGLLQECGELALRIGAPLLAVQTIVNLSLGLLNRGLPQFNIFVISFPLSFLVSMLVLLMTVTSLVYLIGSRGYSQQVYWFENSIRLFGGAQ